AASNTMAPTSPEEILDYLPDKSASGSAPSMEALMASRAAYKAQQNAIISHWGLRLASEVTLVAVPAPQQHDLTITISHPIPQGRCDVAVNEGEVRDGQGSVLLRRQHVTAQVVFTPLLLLPYDLPRAKWGWARKEIATGDSLGDTKPITALFEDTTLARPSP